MDRSQIGGVLKVKPPERVDRITSFALYWALTSGVAGEAIAEIALDASAEFTLYTFPENTAVPAGTNGFLAYSKNQYGLSQEAAKLIFLDAARPLLKPTGLSLVDQDSTPHKVGGTLNLSKAASEDDISSYRIYWGDNQGSKLQATPLVSLAAMGTDLSHAVALDTDIPIGAVRLLAYAVNDYGEAADFLSYAFSDLTACLNSQHTGAACDQCVPGFSNYPACDQCSNPHVSGAACDQCAVDFTNFPDCDTCADPDHAGPECDTCQPGRTGFPACDSCANPLYAGASCDQCAAPYGNFPACDECADPRRTGPFCTECAEGFAGENCDECADPRHTLPHCNACQAQFAQDSFPACDSCVEPNMNEDCSACRFPAADYGTFCTTCLNPIRTPPRCLF
jgi:hypothetical protein